MKLDIDSRNLPKGWLVNSKGFSSRKGKTGLFYCGCLDRNLRMKYCGPTDGPNCESCQKLDEMTKIDKRYKKLI